MSFLTTFIFTQFQLNHILAHKMKQLEIVLTLERRHKFISINLTHLGMKNIFLDMCDIGSSLNMHIMYFPIIKPLFEYIFSYLIALILLNNTFFLPKNVLRSMNLDGLVIRIKVWLLFVGGFFKY